MSLQDYQSQHQHFSLAKFLTFYTDISFVSQHLCSQMAKEELNTQFSGQDWGLLHTPRPVILLRSYANLMLI
jgi:hypothetical protein